MKKIVQWWNSNFLNAELLSSIVLTGIFAIWVICYGGDDIVGLTLRNNRKDIYNALAAIFGALLGFIIAAVAIVLGYANSERLEIIRASDHYDTLWRVFTSAIRALGLATITSLLGLILDSDNSNVTLLIYINFFATLLSSLRLARSIWVLENIISIVAKDRA